MGAGACWIGKPQSSPGMGRRAVRERSGSYNSAASKSLNFCVDRFALSHAYAACKSIACLPTSRTWAASSASIDVNRDTALMFYGSGSASHPASPQVKCRARGSILAAQVGHSASRFSRRSWVAFLTNCTASK